MSTNPVARLGAHHAAGVAILNNELKHAHDADSETAAIEHEIAWTAALGDIAQSFGPAFVWRLVPYVGEPEEDELGLIAEYLEDDGGYVAIEPCSVEHAMSLATLATRLHRINVKLKQLDAGVVSVDAPPTKKGRGRPAGGKAPWAERIVEYAARIYSGAGKIDHDEAERLARRDDIEKSAVLRGARDARQERREADNTDLHRRLGLS